MTLGRTLVMAAMAVAASTVANGGEAEEGAPSNRFAAELLQAHNIERSEFGAEPLRWSPRLASEAQQWARTLASEGRMRHASNDERGGAGENLWMGSAGAYSASFMVAAFAGEKRHFRAGTFPHVSHTGNWRDVGHYTQVVWPGTREVGCAVARNDSDDFLVCRYWPAGNTYGQEIR
ncbi:CAP domain-containing protein [Altererythrobacter sp. BO-6]|uniref:CAP domain-containing protein n=1 Tax=Altererythrobacter sp. BO-6 TaxID=2604537 RepID=UPI001F49C7A8|nr:CAP domain-containing protein [Altererythrobacter sp. BO-6]